MDWRDKRGQKIKDIWHGRKERKGRKEGRTKKKEEREKKNARKGIDGLERREEGGRKNTK